MTGNETSHDASDYTLFGGEFCHIGIRIFPSPTTCPPRRIDISMTYCVFSDLSQIEGRRTRFLAPIHGRNLHGQPTVDGTAELEGEGTVRQTSGRIFDRNPE